MEVVRIPCFEVGGQAVLGRQVKVTTPWLTERHGYDPTYYLMDSWIKQYRTFVTKKEIIIDGSCAYSVLRGIGYRVKLDKEKKIAELKPYDWMEYCWIEEDSAKEGVSE